MPKRILLLPGALEDAGELPLSETLGPEFVSAASQAQICRVESSSGKSRELPWVGLPPDSAEASQGVLAVSAFGADPPIRSVQFQLNVLSFDGSCPRLPTFEPTPEEVREIVKVGRRLETNSMRFVEGRGLIHAWVWEDGSLDCQSVNPEEVDEGWLRQRPEGDGESSLRRLIDDSVNLLGEGSMNRMREEEGLPPLNMLWPWGQGMRPELPNLALLRGAAARYESPDMRLSGLCRLVGYRHGDPWSLGSGTNFSFERVADSLRKTGLGVGVLSPFQAFRFEGREEELAWFGREFAKRLLSPLLKESKQGFGEVSVLATNRQGQGLAFRWAPGANAHTMVPIGLESAVDPSVPVTPLYHWIDRELAG